MKSVESLTDLLRVLGDPTRLRLLTALNHGELSVREITQVTGLSQPRVSRHLKLLCEARILKRTRDQNEVYYRTTIDDDRRALVQEVLGNLPLGDRLATRDRERLTAILDARQARAEELLTHMGVKPLDPTEIEEVGTAVESLLRAHLPERQVGVQLGDLLDIGTGTGSMLGLLAARSRRAVAIDQSREMRLVARATVLSQGLANCTVQAGDMYDLSFPEEHFDIVTMDRVLGAANDPTEAVREAARVVRDAGHLLIVETAGPTTDDAKLAECIGDAGFALLDLQRTARGTAIVVNATRPPQSQSKVA